MVTHRSQTTDKPPVKVHWLYIPTTKPNIFYVIILVVGIFFSGAVAFLFWMLPFWVLYGIDKDPPDWILLFAVIGSCICPPLWIYLLDLFRHRKLMRNPQYRKDRLFNICNQTGSIYRLPQRHVENLLRTKNYTQRKLKKLAKTLPEKTVYIITKYEEEKRELPEQLDTLFEPIEFSFDTEHIYELIYEHLGIDGYEYWESDERTEQEIKSQHRDYLKKYVGYIFGNFIWLAFLVFSLHRVVVGDPIGWLFIFIISIGLIAGLYTNLFANRRWWLVPGGLIYREDFAWRKGMRCSLITPDQSSLLLDWRTGIGLVMDGDKVRKFPMGEHARWLVATGWISQARTPTLEEVQSFLGMDKE